MRSIYGMAGIILLVALTGSCDTTQPLLLEEQLFVLKVRAPGAQTNLFDVYDGFEDSDNDGNPDDVDGDGNPDFFLFCLFRTLTPPGPPPGVSNPTSVPFGYTIEISILREGETESELIVTPAAVSDPDVNLTEYDLTATIFGPVLPLSPITIDTPTGTHIFKFINGRILSEAQRDVMASTSNPLAILQPGPYANKGEGLCSIFDPGDPRIDGGATGPYPYEIVLGKGDTVTVSARRAVSAPLGLTIRNPPAPSLSASFTLGGSEVIVRGTKASGSGPGEGFSFSYTSR
jgi:hypothetical protein